MKKSEVFYVSGYKGQDPHCLYVYSYDTVNNAVEKVSSYDIANASYLCFSPDRRYLYAVIEVREYKGRAGGGIAAFAVEDDGRLRFINDNSTEGESPCHLAVSADGKILYAANYTGGSTISFDLLPSGEIGDKKVLNNHRDFGVASHAVTGRQEGPHAHYIQPVSVGGVSTVWTCDLGLDAVLVLDETGRELTRFQAPAGFGPRHLAFHPALPVAYLVGEFSCAVIALEYGIDKNIFIKASNEVSVLDDKTKVTCAAIRVSPGRKHLLVSNRRAGDEGSVSVLGLDAAGCVTGLKSVIASGGRCPRDFAFNSSGDKVFVTHQDSDNVNVFDWSEEGTLTPTCLSIKVQKPTCVLV